MAQYRALVSIEFDSNDLAELCESLGIDSISPDEAITGELDNLSLGSGWVEQIFRNGEETILRLSGGLMVEINYHDLSDVEESEEAELEDDEDE